MTTAPQRWDESDDQLFLRYGDVFVPRRAEQIDTVCGLVAPLPDRDAPHLLDLGCGEGRLTAALLQNHPEARVTGLDGSDTMLAAAAERLAPFGDRARLVKASLQDRSWRHGTYAAIVSSLTVHHLDDDGKPQLYRDLHTMLVAGGRLVLADLVRPATAAAAAWTACRWDDEVDQQAAAPPGDPSAAGAFRDSRWNTFRYPDLVDKPATLAQHLRWLDEAGFDDTDLCWALAGHMVIAATGRHRDRGAR
ncbi:tRNA (cmo5U34)-methyltransferase [Streptomyces sp. V3I8]|uniref:class I SAM-dependent methyltransferase n=1 Tax=Streptomyces sp. V3I8 TaxID=3042279 RepID=UPI0027851D76|nr:class I SAM-dependent methyltransferase [Streptomyces sp. V3I8]MDQ1041575.1 tRNA (cmo5U34)-methyltransferase [Streptomyces sp. V3I8]